MTKKHKDKIDFDKRGFKTAPLGMIMPSIMRKLGNAAEAKKSAHLIRLINHWPEIIGAEMAQKTMPIRISYSQQIDRETGEQEKIMILKMKAESAVGTKIAIRQNIILDRLNRLFGVESFKRLDITQGKISASPKQLKQQDSVIYDIDLPEIDDPILKSSLESLGQAVMNSALNKEKR